MDTLFLGIGPEDALVLLGQEIVDVDVQLDFARFDHVNLLCVVLLLVEDVANIEFQRFQFWHHSDQEVMFFVLEEF